MADKYAIFDRFAKSLNRYVPEFGGRYGCPLSMSLFSRDAIATGELTEEHCIPKGLGKTCPYSLRNGRITPPEPTSMPTYTE